MISVTYDMILGAIVASIVVGILSGAIYAFFSDGSRLLSRLFKRLIKREGAVAKSTVIGNAFDFFFTLTVGAVYVLILYAFTDGVFFFLPLSAIFLGFLLGKRAIGALLGFSLTNKR